MSRVLCTGLSARLALDIEFLTGYPLVLNDPEVTMPPLNLLAAANCRRGSPSPNAATVRCLLYLPLDAVAEYRVRERTQRLYDIQVVNPNSTL